jgi:hypothetical protein
VDPDLKFKWLDLLIKKEQIFTARVSWLEARLKSSITILVTLIGFFVLFLKTNYISSNYWLNGDFVRSLLLFLLVFWALGLFQELFLARDKTPGRIKDDFVLKRQTLPMFLMGIIFAGTN